MHEFYDLINRSTKLTLESLNEKYENSIKELSYSARTNTIKNLQMIQVQKAVIAIGVFSMFESILQEKFRCKNGFSEAKKRLMAKGELELVKRFDYFIKAVNVLKHGYGRSYNSLASEWESLPFILRNTGDTYFTEGDVSEISTLIDVDDVFVINCVELIELVSKETNS
ncbi:hypothetical protein [Sediminicola luteus]|uniref:RiboL-PSP-HEPN domain-containing protein n=1 Tax=Sediminicola luteus TaxID=319238 RepID=A0A2A4G4K0_9FLAO|nr:hypothetical protein [Sediminicola luteus]PCE62894.1 hypothetical protein B7P33_16595 [Sediminicola luteus]